MKKMVRMVCIGALSGLAFLAACTTQNGLSRKERKQLVKEREQITQWLGDIWSVGDSHTPSIDEYMHRIGYINSLQSRLDTINFRLGDSIDLDYNLRHRVLQQRIDSLNYLIQNYRPPCIYGSPEMMEGSEEIIRPKKSELEVMNDELNKAMQEMDALENEKKGAKKFFEGDAEVLYGVPKP